MIKLTKFTIYKYKSIEQEQCFEVESDVTVLVGMNESGKTSILEALAKTNYFEADEKFELNATHDYPRREKKKMEKSGGTAAATKGEFEISDELMAKIGRDVGPDTFTKNTFSRTTNYNANASMGDYGCDFSKFVDFKTKQSKVHSKTLVEKLAKVSSTEELDELIASYKEEEITKCLESMREYFANEWKWSKDPLAEYVFRVYIKPKLPKFLYYDEYYSLPSRICIQDLENDKLKDEEQKTAKALFDLADIKTSELIDADDFEDFKAELEATQASITDELFEFWSTNQNLDIQFDIDKIEKAGPQQNKRIVEHVLDIRVRNNRTKVSLPLRNRSKGFNWFFSFLVWFKRIQEDQASNYIILLDEPGLNLHATAQADLLQFIESLTDDYQIVFTTHSPFMVDAGKLHRVRTVVETDSGSHISDSLQEKDPKTLFPLQAALGYDIAQNLYISKKNLLVEGVSDLIFLQALSGILEAEGRPSLHDDITIVPVGGLEKVSTFISLMRGSKLDVVWLLDTIEDPANQAKLDRLTAQKIIRSQKIVTFDAFVSGNKADVEDLFELDEYLLLFNEAFHEHTDISESDLDATLERIVVRIADKMGRPRFNHYRPANLLAQKGLAAKDIAAETLNRFQSVFEKVNQLFDTSK